MFALYSILSGYIIYMLFSVIFILVLIVTIKQFRFSVRHFSSFGKRCTLWSLFYKSVDKFIFIYLHIHRVWWSAHFGKLIAFTRASRSLLQNVKIEISRFFGFNVRWWTGRIVSILDNTHSSISSTCLLHSVLKRHHGRFCPSHPFWGW